MNAIGSQLCDPINSGLGDPMTYGGLHNEMDAAAEIGRNPVVKVRTRFKHQMMIQADFGT